MRIGYSLAFLIVSLFVVSDVSKAALISKSASYSPVVQVDNSSQSRSLTVLATDFPAGGIITDVNLTIDFTKSDDPIFSDGTPGGTGNAYIAEIVFELTSSNGTVINIINQGTFTGTSTGGRVTMTFDDSAATVVGGTSLVSGTYRPVESFTDLLGDNPLGTWTLTVRDTAGQDPLTLNSWQLDITTTDATVPEPSTLALLGLGMTGLVFRATRRKRAV